MRLAWIVSMIHLVEQKKIGMYSDLKLSIQSTPHFQFMTFDSFIRIILICEVSL